MKCVSSVPGYQPEENAMSTKTTDSSKFEDTMRPEYDLSSAVRGKYAGRYKGNVRRVSLDPDLAETFPDDASVNGALRLLLRAAAKARGKTPPAA
jgi:hypothetical protein